MSDYRNSQADTATAGGSVSHSHFVRTPDRTDGIGMALRRAFAPCAKSVHEEFAALLSKIDKATGNRG